MHEFNKRVEIPSFHLMSLLVLFETALSCLDHFFSGGRPDNVDQFRADIEQLQKNTVPQFARLVGYNNMDELRRAYHRTIEKLDEQTNISVDELNRLWLRE